jgi:hypothetical protein
LPIHLYKVKLDAGITGFEHADVLAKKSATTYSNTADTSIKSAGCKGNFFYVIYWLAKKMKITKLYKYKITQTWLSHLLGSGTYQSIAARCKHTCTLSISLEIPIL